METKVYTTKDHHIRNDQIDPNALYVLKKLHEAGHTAYLVGGGVRDLLLHKKPKDFDISTSAHPEEIKKLFKKQCILIGRRFPLAHVRFGSEVIEVATFRAGDPMGEELILKDNEWGTAEGDVLRRDFTINGLFYDPLDHRIIDYVGGFEDLQAHFLRVIGDPALRFRQDPVRMIRMLKFMARFGFHVDDLAVKAMEEHGKEITKSSPARILEEIFRMLESGAAEPFFRLLFEHGFLAILMPALTDALASIGNESFFAYLRAVDALNMRGHYRPLFREILTAALLFPFVEAKIHEEYVVRNNLPHLGAIFHICHDMIDAFLTQSFTHFPKKLRHGAMHVMENQFRLTPLQKKKQVSKRILSHPLFLHSLTFLKVRALNHPELFKAYEYWKRLSKGKGDLDAGA